MLLSQTGEAAALRPPGARQDRHFEAEWYEGRRQTLEAVQRRSGGSIAKISSGASVADSPEVSPALEVIGHYKDLSAKMHHAV